jgi:predicted dehydrogenase
VAGVKSNAASQKLSIGVIGYGGRLRDVVRRILAEDSEHRLCVVAAYDPDPGSQETILEDFGPECRICSSEEALANDPELDWVFIGSWNCHHARQAVLALNAGKNVFCEKPLATSLADCLAIREAAEKSGKVFAFGLVLRYSPHCQRVKELILSGAIGRILSFEFNETIGFNHGGYIFGNWRRERRNAGTHILEKCCHDLDLANWFIGSLPVKAGSFGGRNFFTPENAGHIERIGPNEKGTPAYSAWPDAQRRSPFDGKGDLLDNQVVILEYASGARGTFHANCNAGIAERRFYICGTEGALRGDLASGVIEVQKIGWDTKIEKIDTFAGGGHGGGDEVMAKSMVETLLRGAPPLTSVEEGIRSAVVAFGIDQAADECRVVNLDEMWCEAGIDPAAPPQGQPTTAL